MRFMKSDKGLIGIDITSASVKLLELAQCRGSYQVVSYAVKPLRESTIIERRIRDINDVTSTLKTRFRPCATPYASSRRRHSCECGHH